MKALVTGGGGFLGSYITEQLVARGDEVRVFCRNHYPRLDEFGVQWVQGDIRDTTAVASACKGVDIVFHVASVSGIWGSWDYFHAINTHGTLNVINGCRQHQIPRLVYTSSPSVVYDGQNHCHADESLCYPKRYLCHYPATKALAERAVLRAHGRDGLATVALRPHLIWGPRDNHLIPRLIRRARSGRLRQVGEGKNLISMTYVENAAAAHLQAADALTLDSAPGGQAYFINEPEPVNLWKWINRLLQRAGLPPVRKSIPAPVAFAMGACLEGIYRLLRLSGEPPMTCFLASQLSTSHYYDISKAKRDFSYEPPVAVEVGLQKLEPELQRLAQGERG